MLKNYFKLLRQPLRGCVFTNFKYFWSVFSCRLPVAGCQYSLCHINIMMRREINLWDKINLLPHRCRIAGWILFIPGLILSILRFYFGMKPASLEVKVFAIYSSYLNTKYFTFITNNISEEIAGLMLITGLFLMAFSKEKKDIEEQFEENQLLSIRFNSLLKAFYINYILTVLSILFIYGIGFITIMMLNLVSVFIIYLIIFKIQINHHKRVFISIPE
jgi:hypothetical protein